MNKYLIFRTDRIGDFLLTAILINSIKRNNINSFVTIVSSEKNYNYIKSFDNIDEVILLNNNLLSKIKLIKKLRNSYYNYLILHDGKKRSSLISLFLKYGRIIKTNNNPKISYIESIKEIISKLNHNFIESDLNILKNRDYNLSEYTNSNFILFHFDEKWIYNDYISEYTNIEPSKNDFVSFINLLLSVSNKKLVITTGVKCPKVLNDLTENDFGPNVKIFKKLNFLKLENIISKCNLLISCHGSVSHIAAAHNIKQIDVIEKKKSNIYLKWTKHFRNYSSVYRIKFNELSNKIIDLI